MAISFEFVAPVGAGNPILAGDLIALAGGINERIRSGLGDWAWRLPYYWFCAARQIRNPDATGFLWPAQGEYFEAYQSVTPASGWEWPQAGPGESEGTNVASTMGSYVFGISDVPPEDERLADEEVGGLPTGRPVTVIDSWVLGQRQRGAYDYATGTAITPAITAAQSFSSIMQGPYSPHGNSYGGYLPQPASLGNCTTISPTVVQEDNLEIFFTPLIDGLPVVTFPGTCSTVTGDIDQIYYYPSYYLITIVGGNPVTLLRSQYIEGPYSGGARLRRTWGYHVDRVLNQFSAEFRGTEDQQAEEDAGTKKWTSSSYDNQSFFAKQYLLAPARGQVVGEDVRALYPMFRVDNILSRSAGIIGDPYGIDPACVAAAALVFAGFLQGSTTVEILEGTAVRASVTLTGTGVLGTDSKIVVLDPPATGTISIRLATSAIFSTAVNSTIGVEVAELLNYKPQIQDLNLMLRVGGGKLELDQRQDGSGLYNSVARELYTSLVENTALVSPDGAGLPGQTVEINSNAVLDSFRRMSEMIRIQNRHPIRGYAVQNGKAILWLSRQPSRLSGFGDLDWLNNIGPSRSDVANDAVKLGKRYVVVSGSINHGGMAVPIGSTFTPTETYPTYFGAGSVREYSGIYADAPPAGYSNEWVLLWQWKNLELGSTATYRAENYGDHFVFAERAHIFYDAFNAPEKTYQRHFVPGQSESALTTQSDEWIAPEAPSGYRYVPGQNRQVCLPLDTVCEDERERFFKSCPIYEAPYEIESAISEIVGGEELVKLTFKTRFRSHPNAPASFTSDISTWDKALLNEEDYRTDDNALRQYIVWNQTGAHPTVQIGLDCSDTGDRSDSTLIFCDSTPALIPAPKTGDISIGTTPGHFDFVGAIIPHMLFTRLIAKPYATQNDDPDEYSTVLSIDPLIHAEVALRVGCEGWVDGVTTQSIGCTAVTLFDFTYENLCFQAFGGRAIGIMPSAETAYNETDEVRPDKLTGFGPLPTIPTSAELFNQLVRCTNLLDSVRIMLPFDFQTRSRQGVGERTVIDATLGDQATLAGCSGNAGNTSGAGIAWSGLCVEGETTPTGPFASSLDAVSSVQAEFRINASASPTQWDCDGPDWVVQSIRVDQDYTFEYLSADVLYAVPNAWEDMLHTDSSKMLATSANNSGRTNFFRVATIPESIGCGASTGRYTTGDAGLPYLGITNVTTSTSTCDLLPATGRASAIQLSYQSIAGAFNTSSSPNGVCSTPSNANTLSIIPDLTDVISLTIPLV
jgi:hypothetical protein